MALRCEVGRVPFLSLVHRPEDDRLSVGVHQDPFTHETYPMCDACRDFLEGERRTYDEDMYQLWCDQYR